MPVHHNGKRSFDVVRAADGRVRAVWRLLAFFTMFVIGAAVLLGIFRWIADMLPPSPLSVDAFSIAGVGLIDQMAVVLAAIAATWIMLRYVDRDGWSMVMMGREAFDVRQLAKGTLFGALPISLAGIAVFAAGWLAVRESAAGSSFGAAVKLVLFLVPAAFAEELLARGYPFTVMRQAIGPVAAVAITAILFGIVHAKNPGANYQSITAVIVAGVFLAVVLIATRSLYATTLAHAAWNLVMAAILHTPVSGFQLAVPDYRLVDAGPDWATGGHWGPEAGFPAVILVVALIVYLVRAIRATDPAAFKRPAAAASRSADLSSGGTHG